MKIPTLSSFLMLDDSAPYGWHRIKYFLANSVFNIITFWLDLLLIFPLLPLPVFAQAFFIKLSLNAFERFWWGGLEVLREDMRRKPRMNKVFGWMILAVCISVLFFSLAILMIYLKGFNLFDVYVGVLLIGNGFNVVLRTFHAGIYALSRVRRPVWSLCLPPALLLLLAFVFYPYFHEMSWPLALLLSMICRVSLSSYFIYNQYRSLHLLPSRRISFLLPYKKLGQLDFWIGGLGWGLMNMNPFIAFLIVFSFLPNLAIDNRFALILLPLLHLGFEWTQLYYFDFNKTDFSPYIYGKKVFRLSLLTATALSLIFGSISFAFLFWIDGLMFFPAVIVLLTWQIFLSIKETYLYATKTYSKLLICHSIVALAILFYFLKMMPLIPLVFIASLLMAYCEFEKKRFNQVLSFFDALKAVSVERGECRLGRIVLSHAASTHQQLYIANSVVEELRGNGVVTCFGSSEILWFENKSANPLTKAQVSALGGGIITNILIEDWRENGKDLLTQNFEVPVDLPSTTEIIRLFHERVPENEGQFLSGSLSRQIVHLSWHFLHFLRSLKLSQKREIVTFYHPFEDSVLVFALCSQQSSSHARKWKKQVIDWNQQCYLKKILG